MIMESIHLCLTDLLDQDLTANEYFQTLSPEIKNALQDCEVSTFEELQACVSRLKQSPFLG